jgi:hypothetical protein
MTDPYEIAITTYALTLCNSIEKEFAFNLLHSTRLEVAGMMKYVTRTQISLFTHLARCYYLSGFYRTRNFINLVYKTGNVKNRIKLKMIRVL